MDLTNIFISISVGVIIGLITSWIARKSIYQSSIRIVRRNIQGLISELRSEQHNFIEDDTTRRKMIKRLCRIRNELDITTGMWKETYRYRKKMALKRGKPFPYKSEKEYYEWLSQ